VDRIKERWKEDPKLLKFCKRVEEGKGQEFSLKNKVLWFRDRLCVPNIPELNKELLKEAHDLTLVTHRGSIKMCQDLKRHYWWIGMKRDVVNYVARCLICQRVKNEHQNSGGLLQPQPIPVWKWKHITMIYCWITTNEQTPRCYLGNYESIDQVNSLFGY